jgi:FlaG/FlaF family flagellin (archaellin)
MIATVLLIAFTVAVGGIISVWLTGFARTATTGTETRSEALTRCTASGFEVIACTSSTTRIIHYGADLTLFPLSIMTSDGTAVTLSGTDAAALTSGMVRNISLARGTNTSVKVRANCQYGTINVTIEASCSSGAKCWVS